MGDSNKQSYVLTSAGSNIGKTFLMNQLSAFLPSASRIYIENQERDTLNVIDRDNDQCFDYNEMQAALTLFKRKSRRGSVMLDVGNEGVIDLYNTAASDATLSKRNVITVVVISAKNLNRANDVLELLEFLLNEAEVNSENIRIVFNFIPKKYRKDIALIFGKLIKKIEALDIAVNKSAFITDNDIFGVIDSVGHTINDFIYTSQDELSTNVFSADQIDELYEDETDESDQLLDMLDISNTTLNKSDLINTVEYITK